MVNLCDYNYTLLSVNTEVSAADDENLKVEKNDELPGETHAFTSLPEENDGEITNAYCQRFKLEQGTYIVTFELGISEEAKEFLKSDKIFRESVLYLMKISSVSECTFEHLKYEKEVVFKKV